MTFAGKVSRKAKDRSEISERSFDFSEVTGLEPAISALTGQRVNHYTTPPFASSVRSEEIITMKMFASMESNKSTAKNQKE